jgi:NADH-quinone oxidoreductase subunit N
MSIVLSRGYFTRIDRPRGEFYVLVLFSALGMILMASGRSLIVVFVGLELMSVCLYVLAGFLRKRTSSGESALKYFLLGAFVTGFLLYGIALMYGASGTTDIDALALFAASGEATLLFWTGTVLFLGAIAFKIGAFPFHMWIPDVYEGAPTPVTAFMATGAKAAAFAVILGFFSGIDSGAIRVVIAALATLSMIAGNLLALSQDNVKRMLAYSSIAHAGYMLIGVAAGTETGAGGVLFYLVSYLFMNVGALGVVSLHEGPGESNLTYDDYRGFGSSNPGPAMFLAVFLISLAGIPPMGGFMAKYFLFISAVEADMTWLAIVGVLSSLIGIYYYLRLVVCIYFREGGKGEPLRTTGAVLVTLAFAALATIQLGVYPSAVLALIEAF